MPETMNVTGSTPSLQGWDILEHTPSVDNQPDKGDKTKLKEVDGFSFVETDVDIKGQDVIKGANVGPSIEAQIIDGRKRSNFFSRFLSSVGRKLMGAVHVIKSVFTLDVLRPSWWRNNVANYSVSTEAAAKNLTLEDLPKPKDSNPVPFDEFLVAAGTGFGVNDKTEITYKDFKKKLYPNGRPLLKDIVQDPAMQDCWFLSAISATLAAKGPKAIERLIEFNKDTNECTVRLGQELYTIPYKDLYCDKVCCTSESAPWVKILEQAAAMANARQSNLRILYGSVGTGLQLIDGRPYGWNYYAPNEVTVPMLRKALDKHIPVEIGHVNPYLSPGQKVAGVMRDNISPGHAVALLDVQDRGGGKAWLTVLDPYGHTRIISSDAMPRCDFTFGVEGKEGI